MKVTATPPASGHTFSRPRMRLLGTGKRVCAAAGLRRDRGRPLRRAHRPRRLRVLAGLAGPGLAEPVHRRAWSRPRRPVPSPARRAVHRKPPLPARHQRAGDASSIAYSVSCVTAFGNANLSMNTPRSQHCLNSQSARLDRQQLTHPAWQFGVLAPGLGDRHHGRPRRIRDGPGRPVANSAFRRRHRWDVPWYRLR